MIFKKLIPIIITINFILTQYTVEAGMFFYDPPNLEIEVGSTVQWINISGVHDVDGITNTITGEPFNNPEEFYLPVNNGGDMGSVTFDIPGEYNYDCSVGSHAQLGMVGSITVIETNPCEPGYSSYENLPENVTVLDGSTCFYDADLEVLNDLIEANNLGFSSPFEIGKQTWTENRLRIFIVGNYFNGGFITLQTLPENFGDLTDLAMLYLNWNNLTTLPDSMGQLTNLIYLVLSNNYLTSIFDDIGNLENLILLDLGYNELESIPESIGELQNLIYLYLFINQLTSLPESICDLNVNWDGLDNAFIPYFGTGGNQLCDDVPECIENSSNFNTSLEQYYYAFAIEVPQDCGSPGDVNADGSIDVLDIVFTVGIILDTVDYNDNQYDDADLTSDNGVDVIDIVLIIDIILNQ